ENVAAILRDVDVVLGGVSLDVIEVVLARGFSALPSGEQLLDERVVRCPGRERHQEKDSEEFLHRATSASPSSGPNALRPGVMHCTTDRKVAPWDQLAMAEH